jgi:hypothetical protein
MALSLLSRANIVSFLALGGVRVHGPILPEAS